jgi:hypothetical protein
MGMLLLNHNMIVHILLKKEGRKLDLDVKMKAEVNIAGGQVADGLQ